MGLLGGRTGTLAVLRFSVRSRRRRARVGGLPAVSASGNVCRPWCHRRRSDPLHFAIGRGTRRKLNVVVLVTDDVPVVRDGASDLISAARLLGATNVPCGEATTMRSS